MAITFKPQLENSGEEAYSFPMLPVITLVPVTTSVFISKWTYDDSWELNGTFLVFDDGDVGEVASRPAPGLLEGHRYKVTIVFSELTEDISISLGGVYLGNGEGSEGTHTYYVRPINGTVFSIEITDVGTTLEITSIIIEALDPMNIDLLPDEVTAQS